MEILMSEIIRTFGRDLGDFLVPRVCLRLRF